MDGGHWSLLLVVLSREGYLYSCLCLEGRPQVCQSWPLSLSLVVISILTQRVDSVWCRAPTTGGRMMLLEVYYLLRLVEGVVPRPILIDILHFRRVP